MSIAAYEMWLTKFLLPLEVEDEISVYCFNDYLFFLHHLINKEELYM